MERIDVVIVASSIINRIGEFMALLQDIMSQLQEMNILGEGQSWYDIGSVNPADIASNLQSYYGLSDQNLPAHLFQGISSDILRQGVGKTYSPQIEAGGKSLLSGLQQSMGGQSAKQAMGGFAGSSQGMQFQQGARDVYGKGASDILAKAGTQRMQGLQNVQDIINQWRETVAGIQY